MKSLFLSPVPDPAGSRARHREPISPQDLFRRLSLCVPGTREAKRLQREVRRLAEREAQRLSKQKPRHE